jgi:Glycosyl hydrolase family 76
MDAAARAMQAWAALRSWGIRRDGRGGAVVVLAPGGSRAPLWPFGQVLAAAIDVAELTGDHDDAVGLARGLERFRAGDGFAAVPGRWRRRRYFDDNAWIGLALLQLHLQTGEPAPLRAAHRVFGFVSSGQAPSGGVRWIEGKEALNACSTAPGAELAVRLHMATGDPEMLAFAERAVAWIDRELVLRSGLIADRLDAGEVVGTVWSYNQGSTLGARALLHRATGSEEPLEEAGNLAVVSMARFSGDTLWVHPPAFNAIWFRNLLALDAVAPVPGLADALDDYLERVWAKARVPDSGLFTGGGIGSYDRTPVLDQAGLVQLLALRAWPASRRLDIC